MLQRNSLVLLMGLFVASSGALMLDTCCATEGNASRVVQQIDWKVVPADGAISTSGHYYLDHDLKVDRNNGVSILADNVTLDLRGHALRFTGKPHAGTYGITADNRKGITIANGHLGGFWFDIHCTQNQGLRIREIMFDDIPYIGANVAQSKDVVICDNVFENFRYDLPKAKDSTYVIGINIGAKDAVICNNRFVAQPKAGTAREVGVETVFILFSANVSKNCVVTQNELVASELLPRSYGVWVATDAQATIANNSIRNMKYGVCLASEASALICFNRFAADETKTKPMETFGISASGAKDIVNLKNKFEGVSIRAALPQGAAGQHVNRS
ncbi:MAG TPA: NosD domain-containing protein [Lacipirellulaceae bacterium]|nr:NosD domain-containing protein [Lacipirellulaceae bacterium]